jgi:hypothetical protein
MLNFFLQPIPGIFMAGVLPFGSIFDFGSFYHFFLVSYYMLPLPVNFFMQPIPGIIMGGVLPFGCIFIQLFFVLNSIWSSQIYYM